MGVSADSAIFAFSIYGVTSEGFIIKSNDINRSIDYIKNVFIPIILSHVKAYINLTNKCMVVYIS